jgi:hypothetical protein
VDLLPVLREPALSIFTCQINVYDCLLLAAQGILRGYDQVNNLIIQDCCELVFSTTVRGAAAAAAAAAAGLLQQNS